MPARQKKYPKEDLYAVLGVKTNATMQEIKAGQKRKFKEYHSDKPESLERVKVKFPQKLRESDEIYASRMKRQLTHITQVINKAGEELLDATKRQAYDRYRAQKQQSSSKKKTSSSQKQQQSSTGGQSSSTKQQKTYQDGRVYEGALNADDEPHGHGKMTYDDDAEYNGQWANGNMHGQGAYTWANDEMYQGSFDNGSMTGKGTYTWPNGDKYVGQFLNGDHHSKGVMTWADGREYKGQWENDTQQGQGTMTYPDGRVENGNWSYGQFQGAANQSYSAAGSGGGGHANTRGSSGAQSSSNIGRAFNYKVRPFILTSPMKFFSTEYGIDEHALGGQKIYEKINILGGANKPTSLKFNRLSSVGSNGFFVGDVTFQTASGSNEVVWRNVWQPSGHKNNINRIIGGETVTKGKISANLAAIFASAALAFLIYNPTLDNDESKGNTLNTTIKHPPSTVTVATLEARIRADSNWKNLQTQTYNNDKYVGQILRGKRHGHGTYIWTDGYQYIGEWEDGRKHGQGIMYHTKTHNKYIGGWQNGEKHGQGADITYDGITSWQKWKRGELLKSEPFIAPKQEVMANSLEARIRANNKSNKEQPITYSYGEYVGQVKDSKKHGQGIMTYSNGDKYVGEWEDGIKHGQGTMTLADGREYKGQWEDGIKHGQGTMTLADGREYKGQWEYNKKHGQGTMTWTEGMKYVGQFLHGFLLGRGTMTWSDGSVYVGEWDNNRPNGRGVLTHSNGKKYDGDWVRGCLINNERIIFAIFTHRESCKFQISYKREQRRIENFKNQ